MANIANYDQLQTEIGNWLDRTDLSSEIETFIELAEANFNRVIRAPDMITKNDSFSIAGQYTTLPTDTLELIRIVGDLDPVIVLEYLSPEDLSQLRAELTGTGRPHYFTLLGGSSNQLEVLRSPDATYTSSIVYYTRIPALTDSATSNWLLTNHPDIYLFGALVEAEPYLKNDERMPLWIARLAQALTDLRLQGERELYSGSSISMRARALG